MSEGFGQKKQILMQNLKNGSIIRGVWKNPLTSRKSDFWGSLSDTLGGGIWANRPNCDHTFSAIVLCVLSSSIFVDIEFF